MPLHEDSVGFILFLLLPQELALESVEKFGFSFQNLT